MQLTDILTVEQVGAMREISSKPTFAQIYVPFLSDEARGFISAFVGRKSDENFWKPEGRKEKGAEKNMGRNND